MDDQWYQNAIINCLDVETYTDLNGDGIGDVVGLTRRLNYLAALSVTCHWLRPFYPWPNRDHGCDIADYAAIDPRYGTLADFQNSSSGPASLACSRLSNWSRIARLTPIPRSTP